MKKNFSCTGTTWIEDSIITAQNFNCTVEVINNNLKVICLNKETSNDLILSN